MTKSVIRKPKIQNYSMVCNAGFQDPNLSWKAKGLLIYFLTLPDDWQFYVSELCTHSTDGVDSTNSALKELMKAGYVHRSSEKTRNEKGHFKSYVYSIFEVPTKDENDDENDEEEGADGENSGSGKSTKKEKKTKPKKPESVGNKDFAPAGDFPPLDNSDLEKPHILITNLTNNELDINKKEKTTQGGASKELKFIKAYRECIEPNPSKRELQNVLELMNDFKEDLIIFAMEYACDNNKKNLNYIKALLQDWTSKGIQTMDELVQMIAEWRTKNQKAKKNHEAKVTRNADGTVTYPQKKNNFNNYQQRTYDMEKLERQLLGRFTDEEREEMDRERERNEAEREASDEWVKRVLANRHNSSQE